MNMEKKQYIAPTLTVVTFKMERGYSASGYGPDKAFLGLFDIESVDGYNNQGQQNWSGSESNPFGDSW